MLRNLILTIIGIMLFSSLAEAQLNYTVRNEFREPHPTNAPNGGLRTNGGILLVNGVQQPSGFSSSTLLCWIAKAERLCSTESVAHGNRSEACQRSSPSIKTIPIRSIRVLKKWNTD
jgi:hypothetical protein